MNDAPSYQTCSRPGCNATLLPTYVQHAPGALCSTCHNADTMFLCKQDFTRARVRRFVRSRALLRGLFVACLVPFVLLADGFLRLCMPDDEGL